MTKSARLRFDTSVCGLYRAPHTVTSLQTHALAAGLAWIDLDLSGVDGKGTLLQRCHDAFMLPEWFGDNWDALADCLQDLSWRPASGYVVSCRSGGTLASDAPREFDIFLDILSAAASYWRDQGKVFTVVLDTATAGKRGYAPFPA